MCLSHDLFLWQNGLCYSAAAVCSRSEVHKQVPMESDLGAGKGSEGGSPALPWDPLRAFAVQQPPLEAHACTNNNSTVSGLAS